MKKFTTYLCLILCLVLTRLYLPYNVSPLFVLLFISASDSYLLSSLIVTNLAVDFLVNLNAGYSTFSLSYLITMLSVYASYLIGSLLIKLFSNKSPSTTKSLTKYSSALIIPTVHFILTNFVCWLQMSGAFSFISYPAIYSLDLSGLLSCYLASVPYYLNSLISTVLWLSFYQLCTTKDIFKSYLPNFHLPKLHLPKFHLSK